MARALPFGLVLLLSGTLPSERGWAAPDEALHIEAAARALQPGELIVLTITSGDATGAPVVRALGRNIPVIPSGPRTWRALVGVDLNVKPGDYSASATVQHDGKALTARYRLPIEPKQFDTRTLRVDPAFVEPPASVLPRIQREADRLQAIWTMSAPEARWTGTFVRPVPDQANSRFGSRSIFNGKPRSPHSGADFLSPAGTPVAAPNRGRILLAENFYFSGNTVVIDHGLGLFSLFAHLSAFDVREGAEVESGTIIGRVGATGRVTGPHLHWAVRASGARVDPLSLLAVLGSS